MKRKMLLLSTIIFSLLGYLEWGENHKMFLFQMEVEILSKIFIDPISIVHPFIILPLIGQILLVISLVQTEPKKILVYSGIAGLAVLYIFILLVGILSLKYKIAVLTLPFLICCFLLIRSLNKQKFDAN